MKRFILSMTTLGAIVFFTGCDDDDKKKKNNIIGTWEITDATGIEWEEDEGLTGAGTIINTNDPDLDMIGEIFIVSSSTVEIFGDAYDYEFSDGKIMIDFGGDTETFNVEFDGANTMNWTQDEPTEHSDYEFNEGGENYRYYQKSFTLTKQ